MPKVLSKRGGRLVPKGSVYVGRPTKWGNPFEIGQCYQRRYLSRAGAVEAYEDWFLYSTEGVALQKDLEELRDKDLVCWCAPLLCHASILLEQANK